ncbi:hypothetical protein GW17_00009940 [Ensete ventricosum]|nr:hypothetical protein GW17_00009940 [Ensete ventricosum]RZR87059.1 hypothetical protein BHM03_00014362 [Ensete ventricosum]
MDRVLHIDCYKELLSLNDNRIRRMGKKTGGGQETVQFPVRNELRFHRERSLNKDGAKCASRQLKRGEKFYELTYSSFS